MDGFGTPSELRVFKDGSIGAVIQDYPLMDQGITPSPFSQWFTDNGASDGSNDMRVDGSSIPQRFYIKAQDDFDIYIKTISVRISDNGARLNDFGALSALTNGVSWTTSNNSLGDDYVIQDQIQTNLDFIRLGFLTQGVGEGTSAFRADISGSGSETYLPVIDLSQTFGPRWGVRIKRGSNDLLSFIVNDDLDSGIDTFNIKAFGSIVNSN